MLFRIRTFNYRHIHIVGATKTLITIMLKSSNDKCLGYLIDETSSFRVIQIRSRLFAAKPQHPDHPVPGWRAYHTASPVCRDRHLYRIQNARFSKTVPWRPRICQPRVHGRPERLRNFGGVISRPCIRPRLTNRREEERRRFLETLSLLGLSSPGSSSPLLNPELPSRVLGILARFSRENRIIFPVRSFSLARPDPLVHHRRPCLQARTRPTFFFDTPVSPLVREKQVGYHYSNTHVPRLSIIF